MLLLRTKERIVLKTEAKNTVLYACKDCVAYPVLETQYCKRSIAYPVL